jgi:hypothetical protein
VRSNKQRKTILLAVAGLAMAFSLVGAGCSSQDPLAGQPDNIRNGVPPQKPGSDEVDPVSDQALRIRAADYISFQETVEGKTTITGALLQSVDGHEPVQGQDFELMITNLADFGKDATFDAATGEFVWTPQKGYTEQNYTKQAHLDVTIATLKAPIMSKSTKIPVWVTRAKEVPQILSIDLEKTEPLREGERMNFTVKVKDAAALNQDDMRPRLLILPGNGTDAGTFALASSIRYQYEDPSVDSADKSIYTFRMVLDLQGKELTHSKEKFEFAVSALNRFGEQSSSLEKAVTVVTSVKAPSISLPLPDAVTVYRGQDNVIAFTVFDPLGETTLSYNFDRCDALGGGTGCECITTSSGNLSCTLKWKPLPTQKLGLAEQNITIFSQTKVPGDTIAPKNTKFPIRMQVVEGTQAQPDPQPAPTATPGDRQ